eukprot:TRINITY_DN8337_c0_g4_i1.p1 TRINITY_DN8337_c0_g4~~TRINITY_DN8337_c0_g4_i1.p1  ORF type:complete len:191 (+),score=43.42 TRINITY_DN8337_c0_g4_i1:144-716(+)
MCIRDRFLIPVAMFGVPQMVHVALGTQNFSDFDPKYHIVFLFSRCLIPIYFRGCPNNFMEIQVSPDAAIGVIVAVAFQILMFFLQSYYSPSWLIPKIFLPKRHEYFISRDKVPEAKLSQDECVICMSSIRDPPNEIPNLHLNVRDQRLAKRNKSKLMQTPCGHYFHPMCLLSWMTMKMICPTCRSNLTPV